MSIPSKEKEKIQQLSAKAKTAFQTAQTEKELYDCKTQFIGKKSLLTLARKEIKNCPADQKPAWGAFFNQVFQELSIFYNERQKELSQRSLDQKIEREVIDLSLPGPSFPNGSKHPITKLLEQIIEIFIPLGYSIQTGPYVESDWYNFSALNFPPFHPSRDLQDTFYVGKDHVLRTHTSPVQIRSLESLAPPFAVLAPGAVFRSDSDISHSPMFHQVEGLYVNQKVSLADLKGTLSYFLKKLFQSSKIQLRFRPSFFPFTEPSAEYDISCPFCNRKGCSVCKKSGWIEIGGCGLVHPEVFHSVQWDSCQWQGFAFGLGVERLAVILYNIPDIRLFFENDVRFLKQFSAV
ncbi:MAG: phenylalanine--tRNA ligase subunit alpha [Oligoflexia bacterium]|nr:phenylalanine--tRNA ligase subunit alpha [Oligoflexia bacterium]